MQVVLNKAARLALGSTYVNYMHVHLAGLMVEWKISLYLLMLLRSLISTNHLSSLAHQIHVAPLGMVIAQELQPLQEPFFS